MSETRTVTVVMSEEDVSDGAQGECLACPVQMALSRAVRAVGQHGMVWVFHDSAKVMGVAPRTYWDTVLPWYVAQWIELYDRWGHRRRRKPLRPFTLAFTRFGP